MNTLPGFRGRAEGRLWPALSLCALLTAGSVRPAHSQSQMYIYPAKGQNQQQQDKDVTSVTRGPCNKANLTQANPIPATPTTTIHNRIILRSLM